jgi:hypothetical protein
MHTGALSRSQTEANNPVSDSASSTSSDVSTTASLNGSSNSLQSVHGISNSSADNSQSTPRARQGNSTLQDPTLELQAGEYLFLITTFCAFTCNKFYVFKNVIGSVSVSLSLCVLFMSFELLRPL